MSGHSAESDAPRRRDCPECGQYMFLSVAGIWRHWPRWVGDEMPIECRATPPAESSLEGDAPSPVPAAVTASAWRDAADIVETYETVAQAAAGLRAIADLLTRITPSAETGADQ